MRMNAFGANGGGTSAAAIAGRGASGSTRLTTRPPPTAAPALRKARRSSRGIIEWSSMVDPFSVGGAMDGGTDALIGAASADIAGHCGVDVGISRLRRAGEQRRGRHDLAGLAIAALHHLEVEPGLLQRLTLRCAADRLDCS